MADVNPTRQRAIEACFACIARWGIAKTTVEDVAREAGVSRATVYRYFPGGKDELVGAVIAWEANGFFERLARAAAGRESLPGVLEETVIVAHRELRDHAVLQRILETEPDRLLPQLTVENNRILGLIRGFLLLGIHQESGSAGSADAEAAADYLARMVLSLVASPGRWDLTDRAQVAEVVRTELSGAWRSIS